MSSPEKRAEEKFLRGEDVTEDQKLGTAVQKFVQAQSFNAFERLICSYLIQAITGKPLDIVIYTCRAAMTLDEEQCQNLGIDWQKVVSLYGVAQIINTATPWDADSPKMSMNFSSLDWDNDIKPWVKQTTYRFLFDNKFEERVNNLMRSKNEKQIFIFACGRLSLTGYRHLTADFLRYAIPKTQIITRKLAEIISPSTYKEILTLFKTSVPPSKPTMRE